MHEANPGSVFHIDPGDLTLARVSFDMSRGGGGSLDRNGPQQYGTKVKEIITIYSPHTGAEWGDIASLLNPNTPVEANRDTLMDTDAMVKTQLAFAIGLDLGRAHKFASSQRETLAQSIASIMLASRQGEIVPAEPVFIRENPPLTTVPDQRTVLTVLQQKKPGAAVQDVVPYLIEIFDKVKASETPKKDKVTALEELMDFGLRIGSELGHRFGITVDYFAPPTGVGMGVGSIVLEYVKQVDVAALQRAQRHLQETPAEKLFAGVDAYSITQPYSYYYENCIKPYEGKNPEFPVKLFKEGFPDALYTPETHYRELQKMLASLFQVMGIDSTEMTRQSIGVLYEQIVDTYGDFMRARSHLLPEDVSTREKIKVPPMQHRQLLLRDVIRPIRERPGTKKLGRQIYTWYAFWSGISPQRAGYGTRAATTTAQDLIDPTVKERDKDMRYFPPEEVPTDVPPEWMPVTLAWNPASTDDKHLTNKVFVGRDAIGRFGNFVVDMLTRIPDDMTLEEVLQLWQSPFWRSTNMIDTSDPTKMPRVSIAELNKPENRSPAEINPDVLRRHFPAFWAAWMTRGQEPIYLIAPPDDIIMLLFGLSQTTHANPSFTTYESLYGLEENLSDVAGTISVETDPNKRAAGLLFRPPDAETFADLKQRWRSGLIINTYGTKANPNTPESYIIYAGSKLLSSQEVEAFNAHLREGQKVTKELLEKLDI